jgi:hypothetical protein
MILRIFTLNLEPRDPLMFSMDELRSVLNCHLMEYISLHQATAGTFIHRYPVMQLKQLKSSLMVVGICQGADLLWQLGAGAREISAGRSSCAICSQDPKIRDELFGTSIGTHTYEFQTPYLALNQQNAKKFYDQNGKPARDAFMHRILAGHLATLAKSLDYPSSYPIRCDGHLRFKRERIDRENVMVFVGKFTTNLRIPDYLGIGQSVSSGYGTIREIPGASDPVPEKDRQ